ncbi:hypothetical protein [Yoonia sp.]|uniref:hypothetical protein n=1 Tax=Yoonia sp. TaxID=2212373 RepID=UPI0025E37AFA|nr:hypothetical protein [Yoonia sp.]
MTAERYWSLAQLEQTVAVFAHRTSIAVSCCAKPSSPLSESCSAALAEQMNFYFGHYAIMIIRSIGVVYINATSTLRRRFGAVCDGENRSTSGVAGMENAPNQRLGV